MTHVLEPQTRRPGVSLLLIEDDRELASLMRQYLTESGYQVEVVYDGREGLARAFATRNDLVILDIMPHLIGTEVLRYLRRRSPVPVIIVTARGAAEDRVAGLRAGADDYLSKPFEPAELVARIEAVLRRVKQDSFKPSETLAIDGVVLDTGPRRVLANGEPIELTSLEFDILELLMRSAGRVVSRDEMSTVLHQRASTAYERSIDVHVSRLRKKLDRSDDRLITSVRGVGYMYRGGRACEIAVRPHLRHHLRDAGRGPGRVPDDLVHGGS